VTDESGPHQPPQPRDPPRQPANPTPGAVLAAARRVAGLSVEDVAAATRIRSTLVRAIEQDEYERCGGEVYARGHIRSIAHVVGTDSTPLIADYERRYSQPLPPLGVAPVSTLGDPVRELTRKATKATPKWPAVAIAVLTLITVLLAVSWVVGSRQDRQAPPAAATTAPVPSPSTTPTASATPSPSGTPSSSTGAPTSSTSPASGVRLLVRIGQEASYVRVLSSAGVRVYEGILSAGQSMQFSDARSLLVRFGNSPAVTIELNGKILGRPCNTQVCSREFRQPSSQNG